MVFRGVKSTDEGSPEPVELVFRGVKPTDEGSPEPVEVFLWGLEIPMRVVLR